MTKPSRILKALFVLVFAATHTLTSLSKMPIISVREGGTTVARHEAKQSETKNTKLSIYPTHQHSYVIARRRNDDKAI